MTDKDTNNNEYDKIKNDLSDVAREAALKGAAEGVTNAIENSNNISKIGIAREKLLELKSSSIDEEFKFTNAYNPQELDNIREIQNKKNLTDNDLISVFDQLNSIGIKEDRMNTLYNNINKSKVQDVKTDNNSDEYDFGKRKRDNYNISGISVPNSNSSIDDISDRFPKHQAELDDVYRRGISPSSHKEWGSAIKDQTNSYRDDEGKKIFYCWNEELAKLSRDLDPKVKMNWASEPEVLSRSAYDNYHKQEYDIGFESDDIDSINISQQKYDDEVQNAVKNVLRHENISSSKISFLSK